MANIGSYTRRAPNVVKAQGRNKRVVFEQKGQGLTDSSTSAEDSNLRQACGGRRELAGVGKGANGSASKHIDD